MYYTPYINKFKTYKRQYINPEYTIDDSEPINTSVLIDNLEIEESPIEESTFDSWTPKYTFPSSKLETFKQAFVQSGVDEKRFPFFAKLAEKESGFDPIIQNSAGYPAWGYFQFMQGEYNGKKWNNIEDIAKVDINTFLHNPTLQIKAADKLADIFLSQFSQEDKEKAKDMGYSDSALVAGAWLAGPGGVKKFLKGDANPSDIHGTNVRDRMEQFNGYFKNGGILKFASGGSDPGINKALNEQSFLPTGHLASNLNLNSDSIFSIYSKPLGKIADNYGDSLFISNNDYTEDERVKYLFDIRQDLLNLNIPKETSKDIKSLTNYFKSYIDNNTIGYKKISKLSDGRDSIAYFDRDKKYIKREGPRPENLNEGEIIRNVNNKLANINAHALAELWFLYNGISYAKKGMKIRKCQDGNTLHKQVFEWASNKNGELKDAERKNKHFPTWYKLLRDENRPTMHYLDGTHSTHKLSYVEEDGKYFIYPTVQWVKDDKGNWSGTDYDNTFSPYFHSAYGNERWKEGWENAKRNGDYLEIPTENMAKYFTENYKTAFPDTWYPGFSDNSKDTVPQQIVTVINDKPMSNAEPFIPTIKDLAEQLTMAYETYQAMPYILTTKKDGVEQRQTLIGHGIADKEIIKKYKNTGIPKDVSSQYVIDELNRLNDLFIKMQPNYSRLPLNVQLAILDAAYNTTSDNFWEKSPKFTEMVQKGVVDPKILVTELDHSKNADSGWLRDRSAARRALALGKYRWNWQYVDKYGRHYNPDIPLNSRDWNRGLYINNY